MSNSSNHIDLDRVKQELVGRRIEMQRRHAEDLSRLAADEAELDTLEKLIASFLRKFGGGDQPADASEPVEKAVAAEQIGEAEPADAAEKPELTAVHAAGQETEAAAAAEQIEAADDADRQESKATEEVAAPPAARRTSETPRPTSRSKYQMTNFEIFSRASRSGSF